MKRRWAIFLTALLVSSCGFHLRGEARLMAAMARTQVVSANPNSELAEQLGQLLTGAGVALVNEADASAVLSLTEDRLSRQVQSIGAGARVREFALNYHVSFEVRDAQGGPLIPPQSVELTRDYTFDQDEVLSAASEEEFLRREMVREMAAQVLRRIESVGR